MYSAWFRSTFLRALKFLEIKERGPNFWVEPILQKAWIIWSPLLYFNFKRFLGPNSSPFIRFQCIFYDSQVLLSGFSNLYKLKEGGSNFWGEPILENVWIIWSPPFCISILKVLWTQILCHSLYMSHFCMNQEDFSQSPEIFTN